MDDDDVHEEGEYFVHVIGKGCVLSEVVKDDVDSDEHDDLNEGAVFESEDVFANNEDDGGGECGDGVDVHVNVDLKEFL